MLSLNIKGELLSFDRPKVMGILNVTPDSFYAGSRVEEIDALRKRIEEFADQGVDIYDIGGYSSRPGADEVSPEEEIDRLSRGLEQIRSIVPDALISVDTFRAEVAARCIDGFGVEIINDIGGGILDPEIWDVVKEKDVAYVLMHMRGTPSTMQSLTDYDDVTAEVLTDLARKMDALRQMGVANVIVDPGFGFAKTVEQNYQLLRDLDLFHELNAPVLAGISRKTMIWKPLGITPAEAANGTTVLNTLALINGADILRVHDVREAVEVVKLIDLYFSDLEHDANYVNLQVD